MSVHLLAQRQRNAVMAAWRAFSAHQIGAMVDAGFDAGEFSGPSHARMLDREMAQIGRKWGVPDAYGLLNDYVAELTPDYDEPYEIIADSPVALGELTDDELSLHAAEADIVFREFE